MVDVRGDTTTTNSISVGGTLAGTLETVGDHDWYRITLTAGQQVVITLRGSGGTPVEDTFLYIRNSAGDLIAENDDAGFSLNSQLVFTAPTSGTYYIDVGAWNDESAGTYSVSVQPFTVYSNNQIANQLTDGFWEGDDHHFNVTQGGSITVNVTALTAAGRNLARAALASWSDIIGVNFVEVTSGGQIVFDDNEEGAFAEAVWSGGITTSAHVNISTEWLSEYGTGLDSYAYQTYLHEVGHALGLGHAGNYDGDATYPDSALYRNDSWANSVMSYFNQTENTYFADQGFTRNFAVTPMIADILAMQALYGLATNTRTGNTTYGFNSNADNPVYNAAIYDDVAVTIYDRGGNDTLDYSGFGGNQLINLNPETFSNVGFGVGNLAIARGTIIENAIGGSGNDTLIGNSAANVLDGRGGMDTMRGGAGNDIYYVNSSGDQVVESGGQGNDTVRSTVSHTLAANVENLRLLGTSAINGTGNSSANLLVGNSGNNVLDGRGGADTMRGGAGNDIYYVNSSGDQVVESGGQGLDTVRSTVSYTLGDNVEQLSLLGTSAINGAGNSGANLLVGNSANNILDGRGGADTMRGGAGNDTYYVNSSGDQVVENSGQGNDTVRSTVSHSLAANVESLRLLGTGAINGTGNGLDNLLVGNGAANILDGRGGSDDLRGGGGADTFVFRDGEFGGLTAATADRILDFSQAQGDRIDLRLVDADTTLDGLQGFEFIDTDAFTGTAGELRYKQSNGITYVTGDTDGDGIADFMIRLEGLHNLVEADFVI